MMKFLLVTLLLKLGDACTLIYKMTTLLGCEKDYAPTIASLNSSTVTYGAECLLLCRNNINCNGISICPDSGDPGLLSCSLFGSATDGTCRSLTSAAGCTYLEFEIVPHGPQCVPPRVFDEKRDKCVCDPVWMTGPNCDKYYIDCTQAYADGLTSLLPTMVMVIPIRPRMSVAPFLVKCYFGHAGYTVIQRRYDSNLAEYTGRGWEDFRYGFGDVNSAFFLGLEHMYQTLLNGVYCLNVQLLYTDSVIGSSQYYEFNMTDESTNYIVDWDRYGTTVQYPSEDGFTYGGQDMGVKGSRFATHDNDFNGCAEAQGTGWWYNKECSLVNLNLALNKPSPHGATWPRNGSLEKLVLFQLSLIRIG